MCLYLGNFNMNFCRMALYWRALRGKGVLRAEEQIQSVKVINNLRKMLKGKYSICENYFNTPFIVDNRARFDWQEGSRLVLGQPDHIWWAKGQATTALESQPRCHSWQPQTDVRIPGHLFRCLRMQRFDSVNLGLNQLAGWLDLF